MTKNNKNNNWYKPHPSLKEQLIKRVSRLMKETDLDFACIKEGYLDAIEDIFGVNEREEIDEKAFKLLKTK